MIDLKTKILVVEDAASMRAMIVKALQDLGYSDIIEAEDGEKAFDLLLTTNPRVGLILADWNMPKCTGLQLLKLVRATPDYAKTLFIMLTTNSEMSQTLEAVKEGVNSFIVKPFTLDILREKFKAVSQKK